MPRPLCFSHSKDVDGLASAAIVKMATDAEVGLVNYGDLIENLKVVKDTDQVYICDLGLNETLREPFLNEVERIKRFAAVTYIDHHPLEPEWRKKLVDVGIELEHSLDECTAVLAYMKFRSIVKRRASVLAAYGAITDFMDDRLVAKKIISRHDRQFVLLESTLLSYALVGAGDDKAFRGRVVEELSALKFPHEIEGVVEYSRRGLEATAHLMSEVAEKGVKGDWTAHMEAKEGSTGTVANLLIGAFDVPVGVAYRYIRDEDIYEVSLRESYDGEFDLGKIVSMVTRIIGGSGGGHKKACGARIPSALLKEFLDMVEFELDKASLPEGRIGEQQLRFGGVKPLTPSSDI